MPLVQCDRIHGGMTLHEQDPACAAYEDVMFLPVFRGETEQSAQSHGLYDLTGRLIPAAGRFRGPERERAGPAPFTAQRAEGLPFHAGPFFYLGRVTAHYGHFLLDTLCRLWAWPPGGISGTKILYHDAFGPERLFAMPAAAAILRACGLGPEDFVTFHEPVRLGRVIVPAPAIEELHFIHRVFARRFNEIGDRLCAASVARKTDVPLYLTKQNVTSGISHFVNEARFTEVLARAGVRIVAPETLPFAEQVALFRDNSVISGVIGSAFHTTLFTPGCRMMVLNYGPTLWSNQLLIDKANGNTALYLHDEGGRRALPGGGGFGNNFEMADPARLAEAFLRRLEGFARQPGARQGKPAGVKMGRIGCVGIVKNEAAHIAEWVAWQVLAGFDTVFLLDNGSTDGTGAIARALAPGLDVRVFDYPNTSPDYQLRGYEQMARALAGQYDWLAFFDTDEFLRLDEGLNLKTLLAARPEAAVAVSWAMFGANGHREKPEGLVIESFTRRAEAKFPPNRHVKSIIRPELMQAALSPHAFAMEGEYVDLAGRPVAWGHIPGYLPHDPDYAGGALNHYFTRSAAHWREKLARGYPDTTRAPEDFAVYDRNEVEDMRAAARAGDVRAMLVPPRYRHVICACARWETEYIVEWLNYYRALGFDHVFLYCNDDDPGPLYERVLPFTQGPAPFVTFRYHQHLGQQFEMYAHFIANGMAEAQWVSFFDIDEFLRLPEGEQIGDFMRRFAPEVECVLFNWMFFGPNGHKAPPSGPVLEHFTRRQADVHPDTKFVARAGALAQVNFADRGRTHGFWHDFGAALDRPLVAVNVLAEDMTRYPRVQPELAHKFVNVPERRAALLETAVMHHYAFRSEQAYAQRTARGLKGDFAGQGIWLGMAQGPDFAAHLAKVNDVEDLRLAGFWAQMRARARDFATSLPAQEVTPTRPDNISRFKPATQSSHCAWSFAPTKEEDAAGGVNGVLDGARHFHTDHEENPWWQVDLGGIATITEIHILNTTDATHDRFRDFTLSVSIEGSAWVDLLEKRDGEAVEAPVIWAGPGTAWARYVRVTALGAGFLHLSQVEVFGRLP
jgi:glycosyltransferase involved in cell wall biosynthesis